MNPDPVDDPSIQADARLFRRVHPKQIVKDEDTGKARISSGVFRDKDLSINIETLLVEEGHGPDHCLRNDPHHKLVAFTAGLARTLSQIIYPKWEKGNESRGIVYGNKSSSVCNKFRESSDWIIPPVVPPYEVISQEKISMGLEP